MAYNFRNNMLPLDFTKWVLQGAYISKDANLVINPKGKATYSVVSVSAEMRATSRTYRSRVTYVEPLPINRFNPDIVSEITFEYAKLSPEQVIGNVSVSAHPTVDIGTYSLVDFNPLSQAIDVIDYTLCNNSDKAIKVSTIELYASYDMDSASESIIEQKLPAAKSYRNSSTETVGSRNKVVAHIDFAVSSSSTATGTVFTNFNSEYDGMLTSNISHNTKTLRPANVRMPIRKGLNVLSIPFFIAETETGDNKVEWHLQADPTISIMPDMLQLIIESRNMLASSINSASDIRVLENLNMPAVQGMSDHYNHTMFVDNRSGYTESLPSVAAATPTDTATVEFFTHTTIDHEIIEED